MYRQVDVFFWTHCICSRHWHEPLTCSGFWHIINFLLTCLVYSSFSNNIRQDILADRPVGSAALLVPVLVTNPVLSQVHTWQTDRQTQFTSQSHSQEIENTDKYNWDSWVKRDGELTHQLVMLGLVPVTWQSPTHSITHASHFTSQLFNCLSVSEMTWTNRANKRSPMVETYISRYWKWVFRVSFCGHTNIHLCLLPGISNTAA